MMKYLFGLIGLALLGGSPLVGQTPAWGGDAACGRSRVLRRVVQRLLAMRRVQVLPALRLPLVPVCHPYCETKTTIKHEYCCHCKDHCVPGPQHCCKDCDGCCHEECGKCCIREIHKLAIIPVCHEEQVRRCKVEWVCPRCDGQASATAPVIVTPGRRAGAHGSGEPAGPPVAPPPNPAPTKTTSNASQPPDLSTAELR